MPKPSEYQEKVREGNRMMVLSLLKDEEMRFSELQTLSGMSPRGLSKILQDLEGHELVGRKLKGRWPAYDITKKGLSLILNTMTIGFFSDQIQKAGGKYFHDYSKFRLEQESKGWPWGIKDDVIVDKPMEKQISSFLKEITKDMQYTIFEKFQNIMDTADPMKIIDKKFLIGFTIDCNTLLKSYKEISFTMLRKELDVKPSKKNKPRRAKQK